MRLLLAAPKGPPFGGMTANTSALLNSRLNTDNKLIFFNTSPPNHHGHGLLRLLFSIKQLARLFCVLRHYKPEVAYFMSSSFAGFYEKGAMAFLCRLAGIPTAIHLVGGGFDVFYRKSVLSKFLVPMLLNWCDLIMTVSESWKNFVRTIVPQHKIMVIPNPVQSDKYSQAKIGSGDKKGVQILFMGKLVKEKGVLDIIEAIFQKKELYLGSRVILMGNGELCQECARRIRAKHLGDIISLVGYVDDETKIFLLRTSDIFLLPSYIEGLPVAILEAMASGLPVVSTYVGGIPSVVKDGETGYLILPGDLEMLNIKIEILIRDKNMRGEMGEKGRQYIKKEFEAGIVADKLNNALHSLLDSSRQDTLRDMY